MPSLYKLQTAFFAAVVDESVAAPVLTGIDVHRLAIHRNNWRGNLCNALRLSYPVVERLVGVEFFRYAADCFIDTHPSHSSNVENYGKEFADFLQSSSPVQMLPYLPDIARLEAVIERLLVAVNDDEFHLLYSPYPILRIWQVNQPDWQGDDTVDLGEGENFLRIRRADDQVLIESIDAEIFRAGN